jgi:hypothetical protein
MTGTGALHGEPSYTCAMTVLWMVPGLCHFAMAGHQDVSRRGFITGRGTANKTYAQKLRGRTGHQHSRERVCP